MPALTEVVFGSGVKTIGRDALFNCPNLTTVSLSAEVTKIGDGAFFQCQSLEKILFEGSATEWFAIEKGELAFPSSNYDLIFNATLPQ